MFSLGVWFFGIALLYAIVGFGGGSSYTAMLSLADTPYTLIPKISLLCNLLVVSGGCIQYVRKRHLNVKLAVPFLVTSVPFAFLGGAYPLSERNFMILLAISLLGAGLRILFIKNHEGEILTPPRMWIALIVGAFLGGLSGMVGIGGGIFLSPLMINLRWAKGKEVAAIASSFILLNSIAGLIGQWTKGFSFSQVVDYASLFVAVIAGGVIGSYIGTHHKISSLMIQRCTGVLILFVSGRLLLKVLGMPL